MRWMVIVAALVVAGCLSAPQPATSDRSGIHGVVMIGPTCPVMRDPPDPQCADRPYEGEFAVTTADGAVVVATFRSLADGSFNVTVPPGEYAIRLAESKSAPPQCGSAERIVVMERTWTLADVWCDSGIR